MIIAPSGRKYSRDKDGTLMIWYDRGIERNTLILDATYRSYKIWSPDCNNTVQGLASCQEGYSYIASDVNEHYSNPDISKQSKAKLFGDSFLDTRLFYKDVNSGQHNTQCVYEQFSSPEYACGWCFSLDACLPNIQTLVRIFCDAEVIDSLDPTIETHADKALTYQRGGWFSRQAPQFA